MNPLISRRAPGDPLAIRDWYWSVVLLEYRSPRRWLAGAVRLIRRPVVVARRTLRAVRKYGPHIRSRYGVGLARQACLLWWDGIRYAIRSADFYRNQLYLPAERHRLRTVFPVRANYRLLASLDCGADAAIARVIKRKELFATWCADRGFPTAEVVCRVTREGGPDPAVLPPCDLFSKKSRGSGGDGAALWRWDGECRWIGDDDRPRDGRRLLDELRAQAEAEGDADILVQRRLRNHPSLDALAPRALATARMITIRWPDGRVEHGYTLFRLPLATAPVDNMSLGGLGTHVDTATGTLVDARHGYLEQELDFGRLSAHPDTGAPIRGVRLPWWDEARALVEGAHRALGGLPIVGWDVGLTPDGPVLVEANSRPGLLMSQRWEDQPSTVSPYARCIVEHMRLGRHMEARPRRVSDSPPPAPASGGPSPIASVPGATAGAAPPPLAGRAAAAPGPRSDDSLPDR